MRPLGWRPRNREVLRLALDHPTNFRVYGLLFRRRRVLISAEYVADVFCWKFPGGGVVAGETAEGALRREFREETGLEIAIGELLHAPGTLFSPWSKAEYTPAFWRVEAGGEVVVPEDEPVEMSFEDPIEALESGLMAEPERVALRLALEGQDIPR